MHPLQTQLIKQASELSERVAGRGKKEQASAPMLWKYVDPEGTEFWMKERKTTVHSPISGKSFSGRPVRETPSGVGTELRQESAGPGPKVQTKRKKTADEWKATHLIEPEPNTQNG